MSEESPKEGFSQDRAELFEALGHPTRIKILNALASAPLSHSDLKRATGIESSGLLAFHLNKLNGLIKTVEGNYTLTDDGREAIRTISLSGTFNKVEKKGTWRLSVRIFFISLAFALALGGFYEYWTRILSLYVVDYLSFLTTWTIAIYAFQILINPFAMFGLFFWLGRKYDLRNRIGEAVLSIVLGYFIGFFSSKLISIGIVFYVFNASYYGEPLLDIVPSFMQTIQPFFVTFAGLALGYIWSQRDRDVPTT